MELVGGKGSLKQKMSQPEVLAQAEIWVKDIPLQHTLERDGIRMVAIGKMMRSLEGCACPMGVLSRQFLNKLRLEANEMAIIDMEAGVEHFGRGVETSIDGVLIVVEPSLESITLAERIKSLTKGMGINNVWAVLNKISSQDLALKLRGETEKRGIDVIGVMPNDAQIFQACLEGRALGKGKAAKEIGKILDFLQAKLAKG